jgi:branched-chain amino acid transport system substrate-binding protein
VGFAGAAALFALWGCNRTAGTGGGAGNEIVIGEYGSLTGSEADFGVATDNGVKLAAEQINAKGGLLGKKIRVIAQDDQGNADQVGTIVTRFINSDRVDAVIGEVASSLSLRAAPICQQAKVPMISPSSTNPKVTQVGDYIFRVCFTDPQQGAAIAHFASGNLKAKRMAVLRDAASAYSMGLADFAVDAFKKDGGTVVADKSYQKGDDNFRAQLTDIVSSRPDVLLVPGYYSDVSLIAKQAREAGLKVPLLGGDGWDSPNLIKNAGTALEGSYFSNHYSEAQGGPVIQAFVKDYQAKFGQKPNALGALGYDAMNIYADAVTRANSTDKAKVRDALAATKEFHAVTGDITMDENRNASKPVVILQIKGDHFEYLTTVKP